MAQNTKPTMKTAPKMVTRESVLVLRWKICAIRACHVQTRKPGDHIENARACNTASSARRHAAGYHERHERRAGDAQLLHSAARHHDHRSGHAVGEVQINR